MAMPVIQGEKTAGERFPGAVQTYCIEAMMQDRKALQAGTSHFLGQNFSKASGIQFTDVNNTMTYAWTTSWGVSTRLVGGMIMTHADDDGMICPPKLAPQHIVILPIAQKPEDRDRVLTYCKALKKDLESQFYAGAPIRVQLDDRDLGGGVKSWQWIKKGVPIRVEVGPRDIDKDSVFTGRRDKGPKEKTSYTRGEFVAKVASILDEIQTALYQRALAYRTEHTKTIDTKDDFYAFFAEPKKKQSNDPTPIHAGFAMAHFNGDPALEAKIKDDLKVTVRCIPLGGGEPGTCPFTGEPSKQRVVWAKAY
jgi:prolyl-tRNA synthetase